MATRAEIALATAAALKQAEPTLNDISACIGFDGFVDEIIAVVDKRTGPDEFTPLPTIAEFGTRVSAAAGQSANFELVVETAKLGGNGPIMAGALIAAGLKVTYIGNVGYPDLHPVFKPLAEGGEVLSVAEPGHTDALEFSDGKLMMGKLETLKDVNWEQVKARVGLEKLIERFSRAKLVAANNWTMLPSMNEIWLGLQREVFPSLSHRPLFFFDLADPRKRTVASKQVALKIIAGMQESADVVLGLNLSEAEQILEALELDAPADLEAGIEQVAVSVREKLGVHCVVVHPSKSGAAAKAGQSAHFVGPYTSKPLITTGAGDHFNAGFCLGLLIGLDLQHSLCLGTATSGKYVRTKDGKSPSADALYEFLLDFPESEA